MPAQFIQSQTFVLLTGSVASSGSWMDIDKTFNNTVFYRFSGLATGSTATFVLEARDPAGNGGYIIDTIPLTGVNITNIATFSTPVTNGVRANIQNITNGSGYCYLDCSY
jgi:hypothetical protein